MMANLVGDSGCNKGQLSYLVEAICRDFRQHDEVDLKKPGTTRADSPSQQNDLPGQGNIFLWAGRKNRPFALRVFSSVFLGVKFDFSTQM